MLEDDIGRAATQAGSDTSVLLRRAEDLADMGRILDAWPLAEGLAQRPEAPARLLAARILAQLGAQRRSWALVFRTWRANRGDSHAWTQFVRNQAYRHGPRRAWLLMQRHVPRDDAHPQVRAEWHSLQSSTLGALRDFAAARAAHERSLAAASGLAWPLVEWAHVCELADRYDEALDCAQRALALQPGLRSATQALAHLHTLAGRAPQAQALLQEAMLTSQSSSLAGQLFELQFDHGHYAAASTTLDAWERFLPLADPQQLQGVSARRADIALRLGRTEEAAMHAEAAGGEYYAALAQRLRTRAGTPRRVELPVGFVRQHYNTCAPATLAALSGYWQRPAAHLAIAEEICYDGTPQHSERRWAEEQGYDTREFTADWETARALLDAGVPFTLGTVFTGSAHLQAVVGYDELRGTLLVRDPFRPTHGEFTAAPLFETMRASGPRGLALVPQEEAGRLSGIVLPDAALWDAYHRVMHALGRHDRAAAVQAVQALQAQAGGHRLALAAERALAGYDGDETGLLAVTQRLLEQYPDDANLLLGKAASLHQTGSRDEQEDWWRTVLERAGRDPVVLVRHAQFLADDGRLADEAARGLERALRLAPTDAVGWYAMAHNLWQRGAREQALAHYRIAGCLAESAEAHAESYCRAAHAMRRGEEALAFLRERVERLGGRSGAPAMTLFQQLDLLDRTREAFDLLQQALERRPGDPDLLLFAAEAHLRYGQYDDARAALERARPLARVGSWLRMDARLTREQGDAAAALARAEEAAALEPLQLASHRLVASLLWQARGRAAALEHLRAVVRRHPYHVELSQVLLEHLDADDLEEKAAVLQAMVERHRDNAWAVRELAIVLARLRRFEDAERHARAALDLAPRTSETHSTLAFVRLRQALHEDARDHLREAIRLSVDNEYAVSTLLALDNDLQARRTALEFVRAELLRQVTQGDGLLSFMEAAQSTLEPDDLLSLLRYALDERPDLWHSWVAAGSQLTRMGRYDEALEILDGARARFPLLPRIPVEQAQALMLAGRREEARGLLAQALRISPYWARPVRMYVETVLDEGDGWQRALDVLDAGLRRMSDNADLATLRGWILWRNGQAQEAREQVLAALALDPGLRWAWEAIQHIVQGPAAAELLAQAAEGIVAQRPGDAVAWLRLAEYAASGERTLEAAERALALEPRMTAAHVARLRALLRDARHDAVLAALDAAPWGEDLPPVLAVFRARVARARGDAAGALAQMRALLARDPNDFALWQELSDWLDAPGTHADYLEAARHLVRLAPNNHLAQGYLGDALVKTRQPAEAKRHLLRAHELDPSYTFAGLTLADLLLDDAELEAAARVLDAVGRHGDGRALSWRRLRLAVGQQDRGQAGRLFGAYVADNDLPDTVVDPALELMRHAGWDSEVQATVQRTFQAGPCARRAVRAWLRSQGRGWLPGSFYRDIRRALQQDPAHALKLGLLEELAADRQRLPLLRRVLRDWREPLRSDVACWSLAGYALICHDRFRDACAWLADWRQRPDVPSWSLDNTAFALHQCGRHAEARDASLQSLGLEPGNQDARVWLAADAARDGRDAELAQQLAALDLQALRPYYRQLADWLRAYAAALHAGDGRLAMDQMRRARQRMRRDTPTQWLLPVLRARLLRECTPAWQRPLRWLTLRL